MQEKLTDAQVTGSLQLVMAIGEAIRDLRQVPSGELYAILCGKFSLQAYESIIGTLKGAGLVSESNHLLTWIGPTT